MGLCGQILVLPDDRGRLTEFLTNFSYNPFLAIHIYKPSSAGEEELRKGEQNVKSYQMNSRQKRKMRSPGHVFVYILNLTNAKNCLLIFKLISRLKDLLEKEI